MYTVKYYSDIKMNKILIHATWEKQLYDAKWKRTNTVIFVPKRQNIIFFPLCKFPGIGKFTETEGKMMVTKSWAGRFGSCSLLGTYRVSVWVDKKSSGENSGDGLLSIVGVLNTTESYSNMVKMVIFMLYIFYHKEKKSIKQKLNWKDEFSLFVLERVNRRILTSVWVLFCLFLLALSPAWLC